MFRLRNKLLASIAGIGIFLGGAVTAAEFTACQVTDTGGIDDNSFNQTAWKGVLDAQEKLGVDGRFLESQEIDEQAEAFTVGSNIHLGPIELDISHKTRNYEKNRFSCLSR